MPITARKLYRDTLNFFRHQLNTICLLVLLTALISIILNHLFMINGDDYSILSHTDISYNTGMGLQEIIQQMTSAQQKSLLKISLAASFAALISNVILLGSMLVLIPYASKGQHLSPLRAICIAIPTLPYLILLMFVCTVIVQLGMTAFIIPGIVFAIGLSLAPIIMSKEGTGVVQSIHISFRLAFANIRLIIPAIIFWLVTKLSLLMSLKLLFTLHPIIAMLIIAVLSNLVSVLLIIYLSRLYMLKK
ncbi:hypothetical protein GII40_00222 [Candidatus Profftia lariciata]|uniref:YciC family protein n=1 Tax=Candidatus Profftia lariciata TaxID=1987921 RepID=UPI001D019D62|nr:YciC family protein [Candidatus Profftia lariciata]UDG81432.1 hypothetical protein GII40_00222 [Candidatus Profftia lariciata]